MELHNLHIKLDNLFGFHDLGYFTKIKTFFTKLIWRHLFGMKGERPNTCAFAIPIQTKRNHAFFISSAMFNLQHKHFQRLLSFLNCEQMPHAQSLGKVWLWLGILCLHTFLWKMENGQKVLLKTNFFGATNSWAILITSFWRSKNWKH